MPLRMKLLKQNIIYDKKLNNIEKRLAHMLNILEHINLTINNNQIH